MHVIIAIARQAMAGAARSKVVVSLLGLLGLGIVALPLTIKGDGTSSGMLHVLLSYTLGLSFITLSIAGTWSGCAAISAEIQSKRAHILMTKPVRTIQLWVGKWLGLVLLYGLLLLAAGAGIYLQLQWRIHSSTSQEEAALIFNEYLAARSTIYPTLGSLEELAGHASSNEERVALLQAAARHAFTVTPGASPTWTFNLPVTRSAQEPMLLNFSLLSSQIGSVIIEGTWTIMDGDGTVQLKKSGEYVSREPYSLSFSPKVFSNTESLLVQFVLADNHQGSVVVKPGDGLSLRPYAGSFLMNFLRALLILLARLTLFIAIGVTAGSLFSTPTAVLAAAFAALLLATSGHIEKTALAKNLVEEHTHAGHDHGADEGPSAFEQGTHLFFKGLNFLLQPVKKIPVTDYLLNGNHLSAALAGRVLFFHILVYSGLLAWGSALLLQRRELGLPS